MRSLSEKGRFIFIARGLIILMVLGSAGAYVKSRYLIGIDPQDESCLPYTLFVIDRWDQDVEKHHYVAYESVGMQPALEDGEKALKQIVGVEGDKVEIEQQRTLVNGVEQVNGDLNLVNMLEDTDAHDLARSFEVGPNQYFLMGTEDASYDSRYWGPMEDEQIIGRAYAIF